MKKENIDYLQQHIHHWHTLRDTGYIQNVGGETATELLRIAQEEFDPRYLICLRHAQNICELIRYVYGLANGVLEGETTEVEEVAAVAPEISTDAIVILADTEGSPWNGEVRKARGLRSRKGGSSSVPGQQALRAGETLVARMALFGGRPPPEESQ